MSYVCGLDLGQAKDFTALIIAEQRTQPEPTQVWVQPMGRGTGGWRWAVDGALVDTQPQHDPACYDVRHIERFKLGTPYPDIVERVTDLLEQPPLRDNATLIIDGTGVGRPVVDLFRRGHSGRFGIVPALITGGDTESHVDSWHHVPKRDLIGAVQALLQTGRLRFGRFPETPILTSELQDYRVKVTQSAHETFNAREGKHDDLVLALALAVWYAEAHPPLRMTWI